MSSGYKPIGGYVTALLYVLLTIAMAIGSECGFVDEVLATNIVLGAALLSFVLIYIFQVVLEW